MHYVLPLRVVVHTVFGQVDHDAFTRAGWQDETRRQHDLGAGTRQPRIDTRVGRDHFQVAQVIGRADVGERVFILGLDHLDLADDVFARRRQRELQGRCGARRQQSGKGQATGNGGKTRQHPEILRRFDRDKRPIVHRRPPDGEAQPRPKRCLRLKMLGVAGSELRPDWPRTAALGVENGPTERT
ncbi:hypothetical protein D3C80_1403880 [compost metagenome]